MHTPRNQWTLLLGADLTEPTRHAIHHINAIFQGCPPEERPELMLLHVVEQQMVAGAEFCEPTFIWEAGGVTGITPPICEDDMQAAVAASVSSLQPLLKELTEAGWDTSRISIKAVTGGFSKTMIADVLAFHARELQARIVVVGRTRHGKIHEMLLKSIGERLTHYLPGITVWVVGLPKDDCDSSTPDTN